MQYVTEDQVEEYNEAVGDLVEDGYALMGDLWVMKEACKRAGIDWKYFEASAWGVSLRLH